MNTAAAMQYETTEAQLNGPMGPIPFRLFKTQSGFQIAHDIFAGTTYPHVHFVSDVKTIFDVGANIGAASVFFAMLYPHAAVYAFEPARAPFSLLRPNTVPFRNVLSFNFGFNSEEGEGLLYHGKQDSVESSVCPTSRTDSEPELIQLMSAPKFLTVKSIDKVDILKLD